MSDSDPSEYIGNEARAYADDHLEQVDVDPVTWTVEYRDRRNGSRWLMDYPQSELHGGGPPRLRRMTPGA